MRKTFTRFLRSISHARGFHDPTWGNAVSRTLKPEGINTDTPYAAHEAVYRCVSLIARNLSQIPLRVMDGAEVAKESAKGSPGQAATLFAIPNTLQGRREFVESLVTWLLLDGEVFVVMENRDGSYAGPGEIPEEAWPVPGRAVEEEVDPDTKRRTGWKVTLATGTKTYPLHAVVPVMFFNPYAPGRGLSPLSAAAMGYRIDLRAQAFTEALYLNGADPGGILTTDGALSPKQRKEMRTEWEDRHKGESKAGKVAVLEGGLKYLPVTVNAKDLAYIETRALSRKQIATVYGVPPYYLAEQGDSSYAGSRAARRTLWEDAIIPTARLVEDVFATRFFSRVNTNLRLSFDVSVVEALRDDVTTRWEIAERATRVGYPVNEVNKRLELGMPSIEGGDVGTVPMGLAPFPDVTSGAANAEDAGGGLIPDGEPGAPSTNPDALPQDEKASGKGGAGAGPGTPNPVPAGGITAKTAAASGVAPQDTAYNGAQVTALVDVVKSVVLKELPMESAKAILLVAFPMTPEQAAAIVSPAESLSVEVAAKQDAEAASAEKVALAQAKAGPEPKGPPPPPPRVNDAGRTREAPPRAERLVRWRGVAKVMDRGEARVGVRVRSWLREVFAEVRAFVEDGRSRAPARQTWDEWIASRREAWGKRLVKMLDPVYRSIARDAEDGIRPELGGRFIPGPQGDPALLEMLRRKAILVTGAADRTIAGVRQAVALGLDAGEDVRTIQDRISERWKIEQGRSLTIARTESAQTVNAVRDETMRRSGVKATTWTSAGDAAVRDAHAEIDGKTVPIGSTFVEGVSLRFPGDLLAPAPLVVNCRCTAAPEEIADPVPSTP